MPQKYEEGALTADVAPLPLVGVALADCPTGAES